ncbi:hypothetical protein EHS13_33875 [Paenibacillus psychroresistens]|uniref:Uncharacterized protein n=1 Tax=Paenibacillus psychroresistens TaxID=1778678 RepID=A0A6B8RWB7_9BACL|nr:hypothetical protein [Paenibacillus psychroresistens]QGQ99496.1 hypothetical protein EHS13_33875 [Paenibacillus psychroresistens]
MSWGYNKFINFVKRAVILLIVLVFIAFIVLSYSVRNVVPKQTGFADYGQFAESIYLAETKVNYQNKELLNRYFALNLNKPMTKLTNLEIKTLPETGIFKFSYISDEGRAVFVDELGSIYVTVNPHDIRNKSQKGWLWWRLDGGRTSMIYYRTAADPEMVKLVAEIRADTAKK